MAWHPLSDLGAREAQQVCCFGGSSPLSWGELCQVVAGVRACLQGRPQGGWLLWSKDSFFFAAALLALWQEGSYALLPPNEQPASLELLLPQACGALSDQVLGLKDQIRLDQVAPQAPQPWKKLDPKSLAVVLLTSGSSGEPKVLPKELRHLDQEIAQLEALWGKKLGQAPVLATVGQNHIYGLLFRLLWPLAAGRPFHRKTCFFPEDVTQALQEHSGALLVSNPASLSRFVTSPEFSQDLPLPALTFSSGGPLAKEDSSQWLQLMGQRPVEILGSTETGGIGYKCFTPEGIHWQAFPAVEIGRDQEGCLQVRSPFVSPPDLPGGWFTLGDQVELLSSHCFRLGQRMDRIVKIEEKRVSLVEMEQALSNLPGVAGAVVLSTRRIWPEKPRERLAAVVALGAGLPGDTASKRAMVNKLKAQLGQRFDLVTLPRFWRFVPELPLGPAGKPDYQALVGLFEQEV